MNGSSEPQLTVVGIGADGWDGLNQAAREAVLSASLLIGSERQLALLPPTDATRRPWPSPIDELVDQLVSGATGRACVLASGDPMLHGIGATLARRVDPARLIVHPHLSAFTIACARLAWPAADTELVSTVAREPESIGRALQPGRRLLVYATGTQSANAIARVLREQGFGPSRLIVLEQLASPDEQISESSAEEWADRPVASLSSIAVECRAAPGTSARPRLAGLDDSAYESDGQLTKQEVRAITLVKLAPLPGQLLWDVGAGSGSIAIEWLRTETTARAVAIEARPDRAERIARNARTLGVPQLQIVEGEAPAALADLERPDAVFVGGGLGAPGLVEACWQALPAGGRLVANAVTLEGEQVVHAAQAKHGGALTRIEISRAGPIGSFHAWRPLLPVVQWAAVKEPA